MNFIFKTPRALRVFLFLLTAGGLLGLSDCKSGQLPPACKVTGDLVSDSRVNQDSELVLSREKLASLLFTGNMPIHLAALAVQQSKTELTLARTNLLPSINLGALLLAAGQPQFAWVAVESALPFLIPSNWFRAGQARELFQAQKLALQVVQQNQYAQVYSLIGVWRVDRELQNHLSEEFEEAQAAFDRISRSFAVGLVTLEEKNRAESLLAQAGFSLVRVNELLAREEAALRRMFGVEAGVKVVSEGPWEPLSPSLTESRIEEQGVEPVLEQVLGLIPEYQQLSRLIEASQANVWSSVFGFFGGARASLIPEGGGPNAPGTLSPSFSRLSVGAGLNFGVSLIPTIELSELRVKEMELRQVELKREIRQVLEGLKAQIESTRAQLVLAKRAEATAQSSARAARLRLEIGVATLGELEAAHGEWRAAFLSRLRAASELELARLSWQRTLQEGPFAELEPCMVEP
jgi:multidrug efflux system outer membrane protein